MVQQVLSAPTNTKVLNLTPYLPENLPVKIATNLVFVRDIYVNTPLGVWFGRLKEDARHYETQIVQGIFQRLHIGTLGETTTGFLEGGDVCFCRPDLCFIGINSRTNLEGANEFIQKTAVPGTTYAFVHCPGWIEDPSMYRIHLDCIFGMTGDTSCLLWTGATTQRFVTEYQGRQNIPFGKYLVEKGFSVTMVSDNSQENYGCNTVLLDKNTLLVQEQESFNKVPEATHVLFSEIHKMYGGLHCATNWLG